MEHVDIEQINEFTPNGHNGLDPRKIHFVNIGTGKEMTIKDLAETIKSALDFKGEIFFNTSKPDGTMRKLTNVRLLNSLGFKHKIDLEQGIELMYQAYLDKQA